MKNVFEFAPDALTVNGTRLAASYTLEGSTVYALVTVEENGQPLPLRIEFTPDHPDHPAALAVVRPSADVAPADPAVESPAELPAEESAPDMLSTLSHDLAICFQPLTVRADQLPVAQSQPDPEPVQPSADVAPADPAEESPADPAPQALPAPEKPFIGSRIEGNGWLIWFDEQTQRTRVILNRAPSDAVLQAVTAAGFYWSDRMGSFNKKLTMRAYRAAQTLARQLTALC